MPIYEYRCSDCDHVTESITLSIGKEDTGIKCASCGGTNTRRIFSSFSHRVDSAHGHNHGGGKCCGGTGGGDCIPGSCCGGHNH